MRRRRRRRRRLELPADPARGLRRLLHDQGARGVRAPVRRAGERRREALVRRLRRARRADPAGRQAATSTRPPTPSCPTSSTSDGLLEKPVVFATNELVLAVPKDSEISSIDDLTKAGTKIAIGSESVPVGSYTRETLVEAAAGRGEGDPRQRPLERARRDGHRRQAHPGRRRRRLRLRHRRERRRRRARRRSSCPAELQPQVAYGAAVVKGAKQPEARARIRRRAHAGRMRGRAEEGGLRRRLRERAAGSRSRWPPCLAVALTFLTLPVVAIFVELEPRRRCSSSLGEPGALDALWLSLRTTAASIAIIIVVGTPAAYLLPRAVPRQGARGHADRAAARAAARGGRHRAAGGGRPEGDPRRRARGRGHPAVASRPPGSWSR